MSRYHGRYIFVAGLHRTGTSLAARLIADHPEVRAIQASPAPENEGCYLQGAIPHTALHGIPGHYAADPEQHHIESSHFDRLDVRERMEGDWDRWFAPGGQWRVEKSPVNLTRMRLYQQLFPLSQYVVVLRHPEAMAAALAKWSDQPAHELIDYALDAYTHVEDDLPYLHAALVVRYEDLVAEPSDTIASFHRFLGLDPAPVQEALRNGNDDYAGAPAMTPDQAQRAARWGYGANLSIEPFAGHLSHPLRDIHEAVRERTCSES